MLSADEQRALAAALPAMEALASAQRSAPGWLNQDRAGQDR
jgi:hypothetical protein